MAAAGHVTTCSSVIGPQLGRRRLFARSKTDHSCYSAAVDAVDMVRVRAGLGLC